MYKYFKRFVDFFGSIGLIIIAFIPMLIIAFLIWKEDKESPFFIQTRMGKDEKPFKMYKFRSMKTNRVELDGKLTHEQMVTKIGKFIRKTSLDELPQLFNVVKGEMSLIGPRPWILSYYDWMTPVQKRRVKVRPGITGFAQVKGRNGISVEKKIEYDLEYVNHFGLKKDLIVIRETIKEVIKETNAEITEKGIKEEIDELKSNPRNRRRNKIKVKN
ncbi:MAG: sugar transferase [Clostridia bacterium]|nr:sugar transferase [Clostridia bacterium]